MRYAKVLGLAGLALALGCTESLKEATGPTSRALPGEPAFVVVTGAVFTSTNPAEDDVNPSPSDHDLCTNAKDFNGPANNCNLYRSKNFVWLSGGPGPSDLSNGTYVFAVLVPGGQGGGDNPNDCTEKNLSDDPESLNLNCTSSETGAGDPWENRVFSVTDGVIAYTGTHDFENGMIRLMPYDNTTNPGGEYVMAVCNLADATDLTNATDFPPGVLPSECKYDNFKALENEDEECIIPELCQATVTVDKFYDANADGIKQNSEALITWDMLVDATAPALTTPISALPLGFGNHTVQEGRPAIVLNTFWYISHKDVDGGANQIASPISLAIATLAQRTANLSLDAGSAASVLFGNYCTIRPGGRTMGFWSNKNGQDLITTGTGSDLEGLQNYLILRNANGTDFNPSSKTSYKNWLLAATATNMSYMLSAQLSATYLSVRRGFTNPAVIVDGTRTVADEIIYANSLLTDAIDPPVADGKNYTPSGDVLRAEQRVKNILDTINNNGGLGDFIQADVLSCGTRTPFTFLAAQN
jgi:hypothetical protein